MWQLLYRAKMMMADRLAANCIRCLNDDDYGKFDYFSGIAQDCPDASNI